MDREREREFLGIVSELVLILILLLKTNYKILRNHCVAYVMET